MLNTRTIGLAALVALLGASVGAGSVYAASAAQSSPQASMLAPAAAAQAPAKHDAETADDNNGKHDAETADDNEPKGGPDTDNVQQGPGNTAEGPEANEKPGQETPDKNEAAETTAH